MATDLSMLDMAERGDSHGSLVQETPRQVGGREAHRTFEPMAQSQESVESVVQGQDGGLGEQCPLIEWCYKLTLSHSEQVSGPEGLARVKDYDRRFAFYPSFSVERSLALEFRAQRISRLSMEIKALMGELRPEAASESSNLAPPEAVGERIEEMMSQLTDSLAQYGGYYYFLF